MTDLLSLIHSITRPRLLIRAARHGVDDYSRDTTLRRLIGASPGSRALEVVPKLMEREAELERARVEDDGSYSVARHVECLIALLAESRLLPRPPEADGLS